MRGCPGCAASRSPTARGTPRWILYCGLVIVAFFVVLAIFAPLIAPYGFDQVTADGVRFPKQARARLRAPVRAPPCSRPTCSRG